MNFNVLFPIYPSPQPSPTRGEGEMLVLSFTRLAPNLLSSSASLRHDLPRGRCPTHRGSSRRPAPRSRCSSVRLHPCSYHRRAQDRGSGHCDPRSVSTRSRCPSVYWGMPSCHRNTREKSGFANGLRPRMSRNSASTVCTSSSSERFKIS